MTKPMMVWAAFDEKGKFVLALPKRSAAAVEAGHMWASNDPFGGHPFGRSTLTLWEGARRSGWTVRKMEIVEPFWRRNVPPQAQIAGSQPVQAAGRARARLPEH